MKPENIEAAIQESLDKFTYDTSDETHKFGKMKDGIGIYLEDGKWFGNITVGGDITVGYGPYENLVLAKTELLREYFEFQLKSDY